MIKMTTVRHSEEDKLNYDVLAHKGSKLIGSINLQIVPDMVINDIHASCGIINGVTVDKDYRMQGIAQTMLKEAMAKFAKEKVDIAMLARDIPKQSPMYGKVGFVLAGSGEMIASVSNKNIFDLLIRGNRADNKSLTV